MSRGVLAITGGTGFVGRTLIAQAVEAGWQVRALARSPQAARSGVIWVSGALDQPDSLAELFKGADAAIHVAGVTNSPTREGFVRGNIEGTRAVIEALAAHGPKRLIHVSSLSAREPRLSTYGWSKAEAERLIEGSQLDWTMIRPPAIYGPGDHDHIDLFKAARFGLIPLPPSGRISEIHVSDLARLLLAVASDEGSVSKLYEADDDREGGWSHAEFARAIGRAVGRPGVIPLSLPAVLVRLGAGIDRMLRGDKAKLTADRAAYFCHPDWVIDPAKRPPTALWMPEVETGQGLTETAQAYRSAGLL